SLDPEAVAAFNEKYGINKPIPERYIIYVNHLLHGDLGRSTLGQREVADDLAKAIPASIELAVAAVALTVIAGIVLGVVAGINRNRLIDQLIRLLSLGGVSMPIFYLGILALYFFFFR